MTEQELIHRAREAAKAAYAPYSHFPVGASLLTKGGEVISGCNVENASYGLAICAERVAIFSAIAQGFRHFEMMAIVTPTESLASPCGACRQVLYEFAPEMPLVLAGHSEEFQVKLVKDLLPGPFQL